MSEETKNAQEQQANSAGQENEAASPPSAPDLIPLRKAYARLLQVRYPIPDDAELRQRLSELLERCQQIDPSAPEVKAARAALNAK